MFVVRNQCAINMDRIQDVFVGSRKNELIFRCPRYGEHEPQRLCFTFKTADDAMLAFYIIFRNHGDNVVCVNDSDLDFTRRCPL